MRRLGLAPSRRAVIPSYTRRVKTAISVPDGTYARVARKAHELGMSRSEFFARAAERYLDELDDPAVTKLINDVLTRVEDAQDANLAAAEAGRALVRETEDDW